MNNGVCENECVSVWMSGRGGEGVCVEVEGDILLEDLLQRTNR